MTLQELQSLYSQNNLGQFKVFQDPKYGNYLYIPPVGGFSGGYFSVDQQSINQLDQSKLTQGGPMQWFDSSGISHVAFSDPIAGQIQGGVLSGGQQSFENISNQLQSQIQQNQEQQRVSQLNSAIASGDTATVEKLSPGYTLWNGAFVNKSSIPNLQKEGATVQGGNVVGGALPKQTPTTQTLTDISPTGTQTSGVPNQPTSIYRDNNNNFFSVDSQGNKTPLSLDASGHMPLGINADFVPAGQTVSLSQAQTGQVGGTSGGLAFTGAPSWADQNAVDALKFMFGWDDATVQDFIKNNPDAQNFALTAEYQKRQYDMGQAKANIDLQTFNDSYKAAVAELADPNSPLGAKYHDIRQGDIANFSSQLANLQIQTDVTGQAQRQQFQDAQKAQAEQYAAAGQAFSGFREKAKQQLAQQQSGVIASSQSQLKQNLQQTLSPLEQFYGSSQFSSLFPNTGLNYLNPLTGQTNQIAYQPTGGLTGTEKAQQEADLLARQSQIFQTKQTPA